VARRDAGAPGLAGVLDRLLLASTGVGGWPGRPSWACSSRASRGGGPCASSRWR
jgi:hypothetical protein